MQCPNRECGATVDAGARVCPQCGTDLKTSVPPRQNEADTRGTEAPADASHSGRGRTLANASLILAILSCPLFGLAVLYALSFLHQRGLSLLGWLFPPHSALPFLAVLAIAPFLGLAAVVAGHIAIAKGRRASRTGGLPRRALFATVLGYLNIVVPVVLLAWAYFGKGRPNQDMAVCQDNLRKMQTVFREYREEHPGMFPPLSPQPGVLMFSADSIPLKETLPLTCPTIRYAEKGTAAHKAARMQTPPHDDQSYFYLGYAVLNDDDVEAFAQAYRRQIAESGTFDEDLVVEDGEGTHVIHRLSDSVFQALPTTQERLSPPSLEGHQVVAYQTVGLAPTDDVPILIERDLGHVYTDWGPPPPRGAHVLYAYSGVHFIERGTWPMTEKTQRILAELAE
jgi:hypothetical protein